MRHKPECLCQACLDSHVENLREMAEGISIPQPLAENNETIATGNKTMPGTTTTCKEWAERSETAYRWLYLHGLISESVRDRIKAKIIRRLAKVIVQGEK